MSTKACKEYWDNLDQNERPVIAAKNDPVRKLIEQHIPPVRKDENKTCIEIGCYPGRYLSIFGDLGYTLHGVDYCKQLDNLPENLKKAGYRVGSFWNEDFFKLTIDNKYDIVSSFGFIEHFTNYIDVIEKHISLVNDRGYIVIEVPNFIGVFQNWFHSKFDNMNYSRHYIPAMEIDKWIEVLIRNNFQIVYKGYFGDFKFWVEDEERNLSVRIFLRIFKKISLVFLRRILPKDRKFYSPYGGVIAIKK